MVVMLCEKKIHEQEFGGLRRILKKCIFKIRFYSYILQFHNNSDHINYTIQIYFLEISKIFINILNQ